MARWASLVERRRRERPTLLIDTGDFSLPPGTGNRALKERLFLDGMRLLRYDAVGIGESEIRAGLDAVSTAADRHGIPLVCSNLIDRTVGRPALPTTIVKDVGGKRTLFGRTGTVRVGIFAVVLPTLVYGAAPGVAARYEVVDPRLAALEAVTNLRRDGCDLIVAVSHQGWPRSLDLAREVPGIDLVLNAHREHADPYMERIGSTYVVDGGETERSFTEVEVQFAGDTLSAAVTNVCPDALATPGDPRFLKLQARYTKELTRGVSGLGGRRPHER
jgi:2',3'-cyclic-nucleotide 2'-phosphodiesterase (5'-nucleotidase family)